MSLVLDQIKMEMGKPVNEARQEELRSQWPMADFGRTRPRRKRNTPWAWLEYERVNSGEMTVKPLPPQLQEQLDELRWMLPDDAELIAEVPNEESIECAEEFIVAAIRDGIPPHRIVPCADGGTTIIFDRLERFAVLDCFNNGEVVLAKSSGPGTTIAVEVELNDQTTNWVIKELREFFA